jgi:DNA-binding LacI/PurR family transcriptional regulator
MGVTIQQIAENTGVSKATVSRVLNGLAVKYETEQKVKAMMEKMQYRPNRFARGLAASHKTGFLGVVTPSLNPFVGWVITGMEEEARRHGKLLTLATLPFGSVEEREIVHTLTEPPVVDGLLFFLPSPQMEGLIKSLNQRKFPMVVAGEKRFEYLMPTIVLDNLNGGKQATDYLIQKGHRRIGFITGRQDMSDSADREAGYRTALKDAGIPLEEGLILKGDYTIPSGMAAAGKFLGMPHPPTAIFAANDAMAIGVLKTLQNIKKEGLFALVGFDDIEMASFVTPTLTTVGYDLHELGKQAVHKLMRLVLGEEKIRSTLEIKTHLIIRDSA